MKLNPYNPPYYLDVSADALLLTEQYEKSAAAAEKALERIPETVTGKVCLWPRLSKKSVRSHFRSKSN